MTDHHNALAPPRKLGGKIAAGVFALVLLAFVTESQLTQYVQTKLDYRKPYLIFYLVHSSFSASFFLHILYLVLFTGKSYRALRNGLSFAITRHMAPHDDSTTVTPSTPFPTVRFLVLCAIMTTGISIPGLLWFAAMALASVTDVTAIWNTNAFFAYIFTVKLMKLKWGTLRLVAVCLATIGVLIIVYGGSTVSEVPEGDASSQSTRPSGPMVGDLLTLVASAGYGLYQVLYKKNVALPSDEKAPTNMYTHVSGSVDSLEEAQTLDPSDKEDEMVNPPFGLHANLVTSTIGLMTLVTLWLPLPILHFYGVEPFELPTDTRTFLTLAAICMSGLIFNSGFMILLGIWGPIITSVGNLLTIVLTLISDLIFDAVALTVWSLLGAGMIIGAFGVLVYEMRT